MNDWDNEDCGTKPGDTEPHGQKCLYKVHFIDFFRNIPLKKIFRHFHIVSI